MFLHPRPLSGGTLIAALLISGCNRPKLIEVRGTAIHSGKPLSGVTLHFKDAGGWEAAADTDAEGHFTLRRISKGASPEGLNCKVWLTAPRAAKEDAEGKPAGKTRQNPEMVALLKKYGNRESTPKTVEVGDSDVKVDLE